MWQGEVPEPVPPVGAVPLVADVPDPVDVEPLVVVPFVVAPLMFCC